MYALNELIDDVSPQTKLAHSVWAAGKSESRMGGCEIAWAGLPSPVLAGNDAVRCERPEIMLASPTSGRVFTVRRASRPMSMTA